MNLWWVFVTVGVLLMAMEVITPGFIIMWFGLATIVAAIPVYLGAPTSVVLITFAVTLLILTVFVRRIFTNRLTDKGGSLTNASSLIGQQAVVVETIDPVKATGKVRVRKEVWSAGTKGAETIAVDQIVIVKALDGVKLLVAKE
jgi:membrane protein implicated in regulation of membrane protease activity